MECARERGAVARRGILDSMSWADSLSAERRARIAALWPDILARLAAGELIKGLLLEHNLTRIDLARFKTSTPNAIVEWDNAREASADSLYDEAMDEARASVDKELAQHVRTRIDTLKWAARIRNPRLYSDKSSIDVNVRTVDLTKIIQDANARLAAQQQGRIINNSSEQSADARAQSAALQLPIEVSAALDPALLALM